MKLEHTYNTKSLGCVTTLFIYTSEFWVATYKDKKVFSFPLPHPPTTQSQQAQKTLKMEMKEKPFHLQMQTDIAI
jgi:hypothetical protein